MKYLLFILWVAIASVYICCGKQSEPDYYPKNAAQIEGLWRQEIPPYWYWHFSDGLLYESIINWQSPSMVEHFYGYRTSVDTIFLRDMLGTNDRVLTVFFYSKDSAALTETIGPLTAVFKIKRF